MRKVITVTTKSFNTDSVKPKIQAIVAAFDRYLDDYPAKNTRSKHGLMGPVARILDRAKAGGYTDEALIGDAMRVHEMNPKAYKKYLSPVAQQNLEEGTRLLLALCQDVPTTALAKVIDQIDYSLYYQRRTKVILRLEDTRTRFAVFLKERYTSDEELRRAWAKSKGAKTLSLSNVPYPGRRSDNYARDPQRKEDIDAFWQSLDTDEVVEDEEEELS